MSSVAQPRRALTREGWAALASAPSPPLLALWADAGDIFALFIDDETAVLVSTEIVDGGYPALSPARPAAAWSERLVYDLWGYVAIGGSDARPWLDHGRWPVTTPLAPRPGAPRPAGPPEFRFHDSLDQLPIGPVRGGIEPAAHLRFAIDGETVVGFEPLLGYSHKGTLGLMRGKSPRAAARFAARIAGEATVAHSLAFARAAEAALGCEPPPRALALRDVMAGLEQIAGSLDRLTATAEAVGDQLLATRLACHGEAARQSAGLAFGHRLMMDCVVPGGVASDMATDGDAAILRMLEDLAAELPDLRLSGRLAGSDDAPQRPAALGRRIRRAHDLVRAVPDGGLAVPLAAASGEGLGFFADDRGGHIGHWLRLDHGQIAGTFVYDAAWSRWQLLAAAVVGTRLDDLPQVLAAFELCSSGADL